MRVIEVGQVAGEPSPYESLKEIKDGDCKVARFVGALGAEGDEEGTETESNILQGNEHPIRAAKEMSWNHIATLE